jgi:hypothetical protein
VRERGPERRRRLLVAAEPQEGDAEVVEGDRLLRVEREAAGEGFG